MNNVLSVEDCKSYATEANLDKALSRTGLDNFTMGESIACRFIKVRNSAGRWTAIFMVQEFFRINNTGGYVGFASEHGFLTI